jgi:regulator of replication initiation timing
MDTKDQNHINSIALTPEADQALSEIDSKIEEMLRENEAIAQETQLDTETLVADETKAIDSSSTIETLAARRRVQQSKDDVNQIYEVPQERLDELYATMLKGESDILEQLLNLLASSVGFTGGMQKFLDVAVNQLKLGDIDLKKEKFDPIMEQFLDIKILTLLINTLTGGQDKDTLKDIELNIYNKLMHNFFNLTPKDPSTSILTDLQRSLTSGLKELSFEVSKGSTKQGEVNNSFLRKLEHTLKRS